MISPGLAGGRFGGECTHTSVLEFGRFVQVGALPTLAGFVDKVLI